MLCPKCSHEQSGTNKECESCGIIFAKFLHRAQEQKNECNTQVKTEGQKVDPHLAALTSLLFDTRAQVNPFFFAGRSVVFIGLLILAVRFILAPIESNLVGESFMHLINLPFHEAGHVFFRPLGSFLTSLGGSLAQLIMPLICLFALLFQTREPFGAAVCLWWFGESFLDLAPYINDARSLSMPLVGGNYGHSSPYGFHDWQYILTESGLLKHDHLVAKLAFSLGTIIMIIALLWAVILLAKQFKMMRE